MHYSKSKKNTVKRGHKRATYNVKQINAILDAGFIAHVGYVYEDQAISIPMSYGRKNDKIYLHGSQGNRMLRALLEAQTMSMTVMHLDALVLARSGLHHSVNYRSATLFGSVRELLNPTEKEQALLLFMEHMMPGRWDAIRPMHQEEIDRTLVVEMTIESASGKIRDAGVNDEPEDNNLDVWAGLVPIHQVAGRPIPDEGLPQKMPIPNHVIDYCKQNGLPETFNH